MERIPNGREEVVGKGRGGGRGNRLDGWMG